MGHPVCRTTDLGLGTCPCHPSPVTYITQFIASNSDHWANELNVVTIGCPGISTCGHTTIALTGSSVYWVNEKPVHLMGVDMGANCGPYITITGSPTVDSAH